MLVCLVIFSHTGHDNLSRLVTTYRRTAVSGCLTADKCPGVARHSIIAIRTVLDDKNWNCWWVEEDQKHGEECNMTNSLDFFLRYHKLPPRFS
jgi:hypothetical protein